jgi:hypothetical protein
MEIQADPEEPSLLVAFPTGDTSIRIVFSTPIDPETAGRPESYNSEMGLALLDADVHSDAQSRESDASSSHVTLRTEPMSGDSLVVDSIRADGVRSFTGQALVRDESGPFIHGIASIPGIQWPAEEEFPFGSRFEGLVATASCQKDGGVNSNRLIDALGYSFLHVERGGPFNSIKVTGRKHVPGIDEEVKRLSPQGLSPHVLWSGGEIQTIDGETRLVDTGYMEGSILDATPKHFPPPFRVRTSDLAGEEARTFRAKTLQGVIVRFEGITIDGVEEPLRHEGWVSAPHLRSFEFHDESGARLTAVVLHSVRRELRVGQTFTSLRALIHQPQAGRYESIVELDDHFDYPLGRPDGLARRLEDES